jgi:hypothetical protein
LTASRRNEAPARAFASIELKGNLMETPHTETVVEKTVAFVKDVFGMHPAPGVGAQPEYHSTAPEVTAENAMRLDPDAHVMNAVEPMNTEAYVLPIDDAERLQREEGEHPREKSAFELNSESVRAENGG